MGEVILLGERFIVHADQELPAFLELESAIQTHRA